LEIYAVKDIIRDKADSENPYSDPVNEMSVDRQQLKPARLSFTRTHTETDGMIDHLMAHAGEIRHADIIREMIIAALKAGTESGFRADLKLMNATMKEMRFTAKVFSPYRHVKKVTVFGSARTLPKDSLYKMARDLGQVLAEAGYMVITGGGPGIMHAANEGAGFERSFGVNIRLPFEQQSNAVVKGSPRDITYKYFFNRKVAFLKEADAVVIFPGGFGTMDEAMETLTLLQTGKLYPLPLILADEPGGNYWLNWQEFFCRALLYRGYIDKPDLKLFKQVDSPQQAVKTIDRFYAAYHSLRYVNGVLVVRVKQTISDKKLRGLVNGFCDMLLPGGQMRLSGPLPEEADEPDLVHLQRLVIDFNRRDFGRLHQFIDALNN
jgi:uncharacterized protein (TIGR00730 family)